MADPTTPPELADPHALSELVAAVLGVAVRSVEPVAGGIGTRSFFRVTTDGGPGSLIARIDSEEDSRGRPEGVPPEPELEPLRSFLAGAGLPVPKRLGGDGARVTLLEDLGSTTLEDAVAALAPAAREALYRKVLGWVPVLQGLSDPGGLPAFGRRLDAAHFRYKGDLLARYGLAAPSDARRAAIADAFEAIATALADAPLRLAHRDLQSQNVLLRDGTPYLIDLQGALLAPPEYDLVCLLRDSYVALPEDEIARHLAWVRERLPDAPDPETFAMRFDLLTVTRKGKDLGRFVYAARERGDTRFLRYVPATWQTLSHAAGRLAARDSRWRALAELIAEGSPSCAQ